jgi:uncharacterized protein YcbK (DUF882 family)
VLVKNTSLNDPQGLENKIHRRGFITGLAKIVGGVGLSSIPLLTTHLENELLQGFGMQGKSICESAPSKLITNPELSLSFYNRHTGESLKNCVFWAEGKYNTEALKDINKLFRDHRTNTSHDIDCDLLTLLHRMREKLDTQETFHLISGYRSPKSNAMLAGNGHGVAKRSLHMVGKAADIYVPGRTLKQVQSVAKILKVGGVGRYSQFVHVDTGRVRYWGL